MISNNITAIINIFRREHILDEQIEAIKRQTIKPHSIILWNNGNKKVDLTKYKNDSYFKVFDCNYNCGVWSRFIVGLLVNTEYTCVFDDDTIPGINWFKNCLDCMNKKEALYGTIGVVFKNQDNYIILKRYGWDKTNNGNNIESQPVDIVGHSWFFKTKWLNYLIRDSPDVNEYKTVGEDINFSFMLQKYANIPTYVPPHPSNDLTLFGSIPYTALKYGCDGNSGSNVAINFNKAMNKAYKEGFRTLIKRQSATSSKDLDYFINKIRNNELFSLIRFAHDEHYILNNNTIKNIDNWIFTKNGKLSNDLNNSINLASNKCCYIGIPCKCCSVNMSKWYVNNYKLHPNYITFANLFINKNWKKWTSFLLNEKNSFIYIGPYNLPEQFNVQKYINIPLYLVNDWDKLGDEYLKNILDEIKKYKNKLFLFSAGPISNIIIAYAWDQYPFNIYVDIGSSLDIYMKGSSNREYTIDGSKLSQLECKFDSDLINI
jgi:hypothetical protein